MESLMRGLFIFLWIIFLALSGKASSNQLEFYHDLAQFHAPLIFQQVGKNPKGDAITRFNFDGDWVANNNWENLSKFPSPAHVYYEVMETKTHYFITYAFFHPRDYSQVCVVWVCHENDLEGLILTIEKNSGSAGRVIVMETLAHNRIYTNRNPRMVKVPPVLAAKTARVGRMAVWVEAGGHGVYYADSDPRKKNDSWLTYAAGVESENSGFQSRGEYTYTLSRISDELWSHRYALGRGQLFTETFHYQGSRNLAAEIPKAFAGEKYGVGRAHPPWSWEDTSSPFAKGEWFLDPAFVVKMRYGLGREFSLDYVYHPYFQENWSRTDGSTVRKLKSLFFPVAQARR